MIRRQMQPIEPWYRRIALEDGAILLGGIIIFACAFVAWRMLESEPDEPEIPPTSIADAR